MSRRPSAGPLGLLLLLVQYSSIFGTTSIVGVVLGVAALIVRVVDLIRRPPASLADRIDAVIGAVTLGLVAATADLEAIADGFIAVTPLQLDFTHDASLASLSQRYAP